MSFVPSLFCHGDLRRIPTYSKKKPSSSLLFCFGARPRRKGAKSENRTEGEKRPLGTKKVPSSGKRSSFFASRSHTYIHSLCWKVLSSSVIHSPRFRGSFDKFERRKKRWIFISRRFLGHDKGKKRGYRTKKNLGSSKENYQTFCGFRFYKPSFLG